MIHHEILTKWKITSVTLSNNVQMNWSSTTSFKKWLAMENCKQTDLHQYFEKQIDPQKQRANNDPHRRFEKK